MLYPIIPYSFPVKFRILGQRNIEVSLREIRVEIDKVLESLPEESLLEVLVYLKSIKSMSADQIRRLKLFDQILHEDAIVLNKLDVL